MAAAVMRSAHDALKVPLTEAEGPGNQASLTSIFNILINKNL